MAVIDVGETVERGETVNPATMPADSAAVSIEGKARQTDRDVVGLS